MPKSSFYEILNRMKAEWRAGGTNRTADGPLTNAAMYAVFALGGVAPENRLRTAKTYDEPNPFEQQDAETGE